MRVSGTPIDTVGGRAGFTLVELLAVLGTISLLTALVLPALAGARQSSRTAVCGAEIRQLALGTTMYSADHRGLCPPGSPDFAANLTRWHGSRTGPGQAFASSGGTMSAYLEQDAAGNGRACPSFAMRLADLAASRQGFERGCGGYGYNNAFVGQSRGRYSNGIWPLITDHLGASISRFTRPAATICFSDSAFAAQAGAVIEYSFTEPRFWPDGPPLQQRADPSMHFRHGGRDARAMVAWLDGHASAEAREFVWSSGMYAGDPRELGLGWSGTEDSNALYCGQ